MFGKYWSTPESIGATIDLTRDAAHTGSDGKWGCRLRETKTVRTFRERKANDWLDLVGNQ